MLVSAYTVVIFPVVIDLLGGLGRADIRRLVNGNKFEDLHGFVCGAGINSWEVRVEQGKHQDSGSCEALQFI